MRVPFRLPNRKQKAYQNPDGTMSFVGHLRELRDRLIKACLALVIGILISFTFVDWLVNRLLDLAPPLTSNGTPVHISSFEPTERFVTYFQVSLVVGIVIALPVIFYQLFAFITPGLTKDEKGMLFRVLPFISILFLSGAAFVYFLVLPSALDFLLGFGSARIEVQLPIGKFVGFVSNFVFVGGLVFQMPMIIYILARLHLVNTRLLVKARRVMIVVCFVIAAILTPTPDPVNQTIVAVPMYLLYELGVVLSRFVK